MNYIIKKNFFFFILILNSIIYILKKKKFKMDMEFEDDFIDENEEIQNTNNFENEKNNFNEEDEEDFNDFEVKDHLISPQFSEKEFVVNFQKEIETEAMFTNSIKLGSLNKSLNLNLSERNQLSSLLFCIFNDCELLISKNRALLSFSSYDLLENNYKVDGGIYKHSKFFDGYDYSKLNNNEIKDFIDFNLFRFKNINKSLPIIINTISQQLKDPLIRNHQTLNNLKKKINDLHKVNYELSSQTKNIANRLVKLSKIPEDKDIDNSSNFDVVIHQQRLQKSLLRVTSLKESNERTLLENQKILNDLNNISLKLPKQNLISNDLLDLKKKIDELNANIEQSEDEREISMAQRRVSLSRMKNSIDKIINDFNKDEKLLEDIDNKIRIMTQGKSNITKNKSKLSKIPIFNKKL